MSAVIRPIIGFAVAVFALKMTLLCFALGGRGFLTPVDFAGVLFVLAAYATWLIMAMPQPGMMPARGAIQIGKRSAL